jgi:hypothetical protein
MALRIYGEVIGLGRRMRPVILQIARQDADAAKQCRRALMSIALNIPIGGRYAAPSIGSESRWSLPLVSLRARGQPAAWGALAAADADGDGERR